MHLGLEAVQHDDVVAALEQAPDEVRADEAGAAGDESPHAAHYAREPFEPQVPTDNRRRRDYGTGRCAGFVGWCRLGVSRGRCSRRGCWTG